VIKILCLFTWKNQQDANEIEEEEREEEASEEVREARGCEKKTLPQGLWKTPKEGNGEFAMRGRRLLSQAKKTSIRIQAQEGTLR